MVHRKWPIQLTNWGIPALYAVVAVAAGLTIPRFETRILPGFVSPLSIGSAIAIYSSIAAGMLSLTGIVFSLTFVMVQFSAVVYSPPRLGTTSAVRADISLQC